MFDKTVQSEPDLHFSMAKPSILCRIGQEKLGSSPVHVRGNEKALAFDLWLRKVVLAEEILDRDLREQEFAPLGP